jgi:hypothetical protein
MTPEEEYRERLRVLAELDVEKFQEMLAPAALRVLMNVPEEQRRETLVISMHRARYELVEMPEEVREESRRFLQAAGVRRLHGAAWPDDKH